MAALSQNLAEEAAARVATSAVSPRHTPPLLVIYGPILSRSRCDARNLAWVEYPEQNTEVFKEGEEVRLHAHFALSFCRLFAGFLRSFG